jgi:hypothetical protein
MSAEKRILEEIKRYRQINKYIVEQELAGEVPDVGAEELPAADAGAETLPAADTGTEHPN